MSATQTRDHTVFIEAAIAQAIKSRDEGGIPIGSVLVLNG